MDNPEGKFETTIFSHFDDKLDTYLDELKSPRAPERIRKSWITKRLDLDERDFRTLRRKGIIRLGRGNIHVNHQDAEFIGHIWYYYRNGAPLELAASMAERFLKGGRPF